MDYDLSDIIDGDYNADYLNNRQSGGGCGGTDDDPMNTESFLPFLSSGSVGSRQYGGAMNADKEYSRGEILRGLNMLAGGSRMNRMTGGQFGGNKLIEAGEGSKGSRQLFKVQPNSFFYVTIDKEVTFDPDEFQSGQRGTNNRNKYEVVYTSPQIAAGDVNRADNSVQCFVATNMDRVFQDVEDTTVINQLQNKDNYDEYGKIKDSVLIKTFENMLEQQGAIKSVAYNIKGTTDYYLVLDVTRYYADSNYQFIGGVKKAQDGGWDISGQIPDELASKLLGQAVSPNYIYKSTGEYGPEPEPVPGGITQAEIDAMKKEGIQVLGGFSPASGLTSFLRDLLN